VTTRDLRIQESTNQGAPRGSRIQVLPGGGPRIQGRPEDHARILGPRVLGSRSFHGLRRNVLFHLTSTESKLACCSAMTNKNILACWTFTGFFSDFFPLKVSVPEIFALMLSLRDLIHLATIKTKRSNAKLLLSA
jgi:hypothetical protein